MSEGAKNTGDLHGEQRDEPKTTSRLSSGLGSSHWRVTRRRRSVRVGRTPATI